MPRRSRCHSRPRDDEIVPVIELEFYRNREGLTIANGWGDPAASAHSNYTKKNGERHMTKCISQTECIFFVASKGNGSLRFAQVVQRAMSKRNSGSGSPL